MTLIELCQAVDMPARQIRYLIAEEALPPATGTGRGADAYTPTHLRLARDCKRLLDAGVAVRALTAVLAAEERSVVFRDARFELRSHGDDALEGLEDEDVRSLLEGIERALKTCLKPRKGP